MKITKLAVLVFVAAASPVMAQPTGEAGQTYRSRYFLSGFLLRSSNVCPKKPKQVIDTAFKLISSSEYKTISKSYPQTTEQWLTEGANAFNSGLMEDGLRSICVYAAGLREKASKLD